MKILTIQNNSKNYNNDYNDNNNCSNNDNDNNEIMMKKIFKDKII